jgi:hypothetical protein
MQMLINPRRRKKRRASARRRHRRMSALQRKYFGKRRSRRHARRIVARTIQVRANPSRRRRRSSRRRSFRRNPVSMPAIRASMGSVQRALGDAAIGAGGAIVTDIAMGQAARFLPANLVSRYDDAGNTNWLYYLTKGTIAVGLGVAGATFLPGRMRGWAARGTVGALTVMAYELGRSFVPPALTMGYYNPARVAGLRRVGRMGFYPRGNAGGVARLGASFPHGASTGSLTMDDTRVGEGAIN